MAEAEPSSSGHSYEVLGKLAEGGTTEIFLARAKGVGAVERFVVLKRLKRAVISHVEKVQLFLDEAKLASQLQHPNIAQVFEVGKLGGSYFFAMEFVNGETLQSLLLHARTKKIQIPVRAVLTIASAIAAGLHHAHDRNGTDGMPLGIVHGEVSPTNTLVSQEGIVKLVDFGIAKAGQQGHGRVTPYSSPEQVRGDPLDRRSDLFSLGIALWELLTLDPLYQRASDDEIKQAIENDEPAKPSAKRYDVPPELDAMILKLLAKNPADRFQDADELLAAIEGLAQKLSILLSTADLSRMMRLWFGTKSEPTVDPAAADAAQPLVIASEEIPADLAAAIHTPIDDQLDAVRGAAALITARATARAGSATGRQDKPTVPPELMDNPNENFEQIRDRILARARAKKETNQRALLGTAIPGIEQSHLASGALTASSVGSTSGGSADDHHSRDRHTRTTAQAPISVIEEAVRQAGIADPVDISANGANGANRRPEASDTVVVEPDLRPSRTQSGEFGSRGASGIISRREASVVHDDGREAPPAIADVAKPQEASVVANEEAVAKVLATAAQPAVATADRAKTDSVKPAVKDEAPVARAAAVSTVATEAKTDAKAIAKDLAAKAHAKAAAQKVDETDGTERVARATPRATTADVTGARPAWLLPVIGLAVLMIILLVVLKLRSGGSSSQSSTQTQTQTAVTPPVVADAYVAPQVAIDAMVVVQTVDAEVVATVPPDAAVTVAQTDPNAKDPNAKDPNAKDPNAKDPNAKDPNAKDPNAKDPNAKDPGEKKEPKKEPKKDPVEKKEPEATKGIAELFAAGDFAKTNTACTKEVVFSAEKLQMCATAACQTKNTALAKRWVNAISKAARPDMIEKCKALGVDLEPAPAPPAPAPAPSAPSAPAPAAPSAPAPAPASP